MRLVVKPLALVLGQKGSVSVENLRLWVVKRESNTRLMEKMNVVGL